MLALAKEKRIAWQGMDKAVSLITLLLISSSALFSVSEAHAFCSRAIASRSCPKPPTIDTINLEAYLGRWYEIGSTASFKLLTETGLSCNQAFYTSTAGKLSLVNSGLQVIDGTSQVRGVNAAAGGVCSGARQACYQLEAAGMVSQALKGIIHTELAHQINSWTEAAALNLQRIAEDITQIQTLNGQISQANVSSLKSSIVGIKGFVKAARTKQRQVAGLVQELNKLTAQLSHKAEISGNARQKFEKAAKSLTSIAATVKASSSSMKSSLNALEAQASSLLTTGQPIKKPYVYRVTGNITQPSATSAGKLEVTILGMKGPYWIIGLQSDSKGAYSAALVYSCQEVAGESATSTLFVLSREPQLDQATLHGFLAKAESLGIYNDCDNPFLFTLQRGGTCGKPPSS